MSNTNLGLSIDTLKQYTINMMDKCDELLSLSIKSILDKDIEGCKSLIKQDDEIDLLREYNIVGVVNFKYNRSLKKFKEDLVNYL